MTQRLILLLASGMNWFNKLYLPITADSLQGHDWSGSGGFSLTHILERRKWTKKPERELLGYPDIVELKKIWSIYEYLVNEK